MAPFRARPAPDDPLPTHDISKELEIETATAVLENENGHGHKGGNSLSDGAEKSGSFNPYDSGSERDRERESEADADAERGHRDSDEKRASEKTWLLDRKEEVEITPVEAFGVDVSGDQSPFPEVAACVPNTDDPSLPVGTLRAWILLTFFVIIFAGVNIFFGLRYPSLTLGYVVAQILVHPIGLAWGKLPRCRVPLGRFSFDLNPGPWSIKEHALITIMTAQPYALGSLVAISSPVYWGRDFGPGFSFLYLLSTQMLGFGLAGLTRRWLVYPAALIWPSSLASTVLFRALHEPQDKTPVNGWTVTRYKYFGVLSVGAFVLFWFPDYIWTTTSAFAFVTWIVPNNQKVNTIFGMSSGLGLLPLSIDWTQITYAGQPLTTPFWVTCNAFAVVLFFYLFLSPILYYTNVWHSAHSTFDRFGKSYNITRVLDSAGEFSLEKYKQYSPMYISMSYSLSYGLSFAAVTAMVVHTYLYNRHEIWARLKNARHGGEDVHMRMMRRYRTVPDWWYLVLTAVVVGLGIFVTRYWDMQLPVWGFIVLCLGWGVVLLIPEGILEGTTNQRIFLNIITELCAGYAFPGKPLANLAVKMYGYNAVKHGMDWSMDMKLGVYMKIPPRTLFFAQIYSTLLATTVQTGVLHWMMGHIQGLCTPNQPDRFICAGAKVVYQASLIWGTIGPQRMFERGETYTGLMHFFWIGPVVTVIVWLLYRRYPQSLLRYINVPIFFNAAGNIPPANTTQYSLWFIFGFLFNYLIRQRAIGWWKRYNYLTQAAMDTGTALATIIIFFCLSYTGVKLVWWGNTVGADTMDKKGTPWLSVPSGSYFGRGPGEF